MFPCSRLWTLVLTLPLALGLWFGMVLHLPRVEYPGSAFLANVEALLDKVVAECATADEATARANQWQTHWCDPNGSNHYCVEVQVTSPHEWVLVAVPEKPWTYRSPWWRRLLFLDFTRTDYPTYRIRSSGQ